MVLTPPPPLLLTVAGRKYHYPPVQVIAHLLPRKFWELLFIARLRIILRNNIESRLVRLSAVLVRSVIRGTSWRSAPIAFNHYGLHKGRYLKYCYSIFNEQQRVKFNPLYISHEKRKIQGFILKIFSKIYKWCLIGLI